MAQIPNGALRIPQVATLISDGVRFRLKQSAVSTRVLQGLLGALVGCVGVAWWRVEARGVLPKDPGSIAGAASLVAGAEMLGLGVVPPGAEWWDEGQVGERRLFEGCTFGLRWWERGGGGGAQGRRFGVDVEEVGDA